MSLYRKHRPKTLDEMIGNELLVESLRTMLKKPEDERPHSFLLTGPHGCGKTTLGRILAKEFGCSTITELDTAQFGNIDQIRDIRRTMRLRGLAGGNRAWILDECHQLGQGGASEKNLPQNALLKALEEPPSHVYFFLCTTDPHRLLNTIRSRCMHYEVQVLSESNVVVLLSKICKAEGKRVPKEVMQQIAKDTGGHARDAITTLERVIDLPVKSMLEAAKESADVEAQTIDLCQALMKRASWKAVQPILNGLRQEDPERIRRAVRGYCTAVLLKSDNAKAYLITDVFKEPFYNGGFDDVVWACYTVLEAE